MKWTTAMLTGAAIIAAACTDGAITTPPPPPPPQPPPGSLVIRSERDTTLSADTLIVGGNVWLRVSGVDTTAAVVWAVSDTGAVHVAENRHARVHVNGHKAGVVTLTATLDGRSGAFALLVRDVPPADHPPVARITGPTTAVAGTAVTFKATNSTDPDQDALHFRWSFGDGSANDTASTVAHTYSASGTRTVTLVATDPAGLADTATQDVVVAQGSPSGGYDVVDLGTIGGDSVDPRALNDHGDVVGCATTSSGEWHAFLWTQGTMKDLAPTAGRTCAEAITNSSLIAGSTGGAPGDQSDIQVLVWNNGVRTQLGTLFSEGPITVVALNAQGDVVAHRADLGHSFESALWKNGAKQSLGSLSTSTSAFANAMNDNGQIVGYSPVRDYKGEHINHGFIWENGVMRDLGVLADPICIDAPDQKCGYAEAVAINNGGQVVGFSTSPGGSSTGVLWSNGTIKDLGFPRPVAINDAGDVAGFGKNIDPAYFWHQGSLRQIGSLGGRTQVVGMNGSSVVAGWSVASSKDNTPHVFVWKPGDAELTDLGTGPSSAHAIAAFAVAINEHGDVLGRTFGSCINPGPFYGSCQYFGGPTHAVLWKKRG